MTEQELRDFIKEEIKSLSEGVAEKQLLKESKSNSDKTKKAFIDKDYGWDHRDLEKARFRAFDGDYGFGPILMAVRIAKGNPYTLPMPWDKSDAKFIAKTIKALKSIDEDRIDEIWDKYRDAFDNSVEDNY